MKLLKKIVVFISCAAILMSALAVFVFSESTEAPVLQVEFDISNNNQPKLPVSAAPAPENEQNAYKAYLNKLVSPPFFALIRDYPALTIWMRSFAFGGSSTYEGVGGNQIYLKLTSATYKLYGYEDYTDPSGMVEQLMAVAESFEPTGESLYDKLLSIHDYVCKMSTYVTYEDGALYCYSAYGALVNRQSVCEGYAEAFKLLCDLNGIDCIIVTGTSETSNASGPHMWNYVRMDDGNWYAVDATWDDSGDRPDIKNYFLVGSQTVIDNKTFAQSHLPSFDFTTSSDLTIDCFTYPTLAENAYDPESGKIEYTAGEGLTYYYSALDNTQKEIYDELLKYIKVNLPSFPDKTPVPAPTDDIPVSSTETTTPEDSSSSDEQSSTTSSEQTTTQSSETSSSETSTTESSDTTSSDITTTQSTDTSTSETTTPEPTTTPDTTPTTTATNTPTTEVSEDTEPSTSEEISTAVTNEDTTDPTVTSPKNTSEATTEKQTKKPSTVDLYETLKVVIIVCAILCLSAILSVIVIKFAKKHK